MLVLLLVVVVTLLLAQRLCGVEAASLTAKPLPHTRLSFRPRFFGAVTVLASANGL